MGQDLILKNVIAKKNNLGNMEEKSGPDAIINNIFNILKTSKRSLPWEPSFGSDLFKYLFEPLDDVLVETVERQLTIDIQAWEDRYDDFSISIEKNDEQKILTIEISLSFKGQSITETFNRTQFEVERKILPIDKEKELNNVSLLPVDKIVGASLEID